MKLANNIIGNILGKSRKKGGKSDWDGDGVVNSKDCQPRNTMRQDYVVKQVGNKYMIFDKGIGEFLMGYSFNTSEEAERVVSATRR